MNLVYEERVYENFSQGFSKGEVTCTLITLFIESCLHVYANLRSPNFDTRNSTQMFGIMWQACKFELTTLKFVRYIWQACKFG